MHGLGHEIKKKRKLLGLTQAEVADQYMSIAKLSNIETGKVQPDQETWIYLKKKLQIDDSLVVINNAKDQINLYFSQAESYLKTNLIDKAIEKYQIIIEMANTALFFSDSALAYSQLGSIYIDQREYKLAHSYLVKALDFFEKGGDLPKLLDCKLRIGLLYFKQEQFLKSLEHLNQLLIEIPDHLNHMKGPLFYNIASIYYRLNDLDNANYACEQAQLFLAEDQDDYLIATLILQAILLKRVRMYFIAKEKLEKAKELAIKYNNSTLLAKCWHNFGDLELESKNYEQALEYFLLSLELKENTKDVIGVIRTNVYMAELYLQTERLEKALQCGNRASTLSRNIHSKYEELMSLSTLSKIFLAIGERDKFLDISFKAMSLADELKVDNKKIEILESIAKHYHEIGDVNKSSEMLYRAFKIKYKLD